MVGTQIDRLTEYSGMGSRAHKFRKILFKHLLQRFIQEQRVPGYILIIAMILQYFILTIIPPDYFTSDAALLSVVVCWLLVTIGISPCATRLSIYMTIAFTYIVYPMMVWGHTAKVEWIIKNGSESSLTGLTMALDSILLVVSLGVIILLSLFANNIPSKSPQAYLSRTSFIVSMLSITIGQLMSAFASSGESFATKILTSILCQLILLINIYNSVVRPVFWDAKINKVYCIGLVYHWTIRLFAQLSMIEGFQPYMWWGVIFIFIFIKFFIAVWTRIDHRDPFIKSKGLNSRLYFGLRMALSMARPITQPDYQTLLYLGIWSAYSGNLEDNSLDSLHNFLAHHFENTMGNSRTASVAMIKLQMLRKRLGLKDLRIVVQKLLKEKRRHSIFSQFDIFFYRKVFESKIRASHSFRSRDVNGEIEPTTDVFDYMQEYLVQRDNDTDIPLIANNHSLVNQQTEMNTYLNLERPFKDMKMYNQALTYISQELEVKEQLYRKLELDPKVKSSDLYKLNASSLEIKRKVGRLYKAFNFEQVDRSSYTYPLFMYYFGNVRNKISTSEEIFSMYKNKLNRIYRHKYRFQDSSKGAEGIEANSATFQVSLSEHDTGQILNASVNYFEFLGHPKNGTAVGHNINDMLPPVMNSKHRQAMNSLPKIDELNTHARDLFIVGFDTFLRQTKVVIRMCPDISKNVTSLVRLSFNTRSTTSVVLVDKQLKIISADDKFWNFFDKFETQKEFTSINQLSKQVASAVTILNIAKQIQGRGYRLNNADNRYEQDQDGNIPSTSTTLGTSNNKNSRKPSLTGELLKMYQCLQEFTTMNASVGIKYAVDAESMYANHIRDGGFICSIEPCQKLGLDLVKLQLRFDDAVHIPSTKNIPPSKFNIIKPHRVESNTEDTSSLSRKNRRYTYSREGKSESNFNKLDKGKDLAKSFTELMQSPVTALENMILQHLMNSHTPLEMMFPELIATDDDQRLLIGDCKKIMVELSKCFGVQEPGQHSATMRLKSIVVRDDAFESENKKSNTLFSRARPEHQISITQSFVAASPSIVSPVPAFGGTNSSRRIISRTMGAPSSMKDLEEESNTNWPQPKAHPLLFATMTMGARMEESTEQDPGATNSVSKSPLKKWKSKLVLMRNTNRVVQTKKNDIEAIVVASSNLIGKILNKVMVGID